VHGYSNAVSTLDSELIAPFYAEGFRYCPDTLALSRDSLLVVIDGLRKEFQRYDVTSDRIDLTPLSRDAAVALIRFHTLQTDTLGVDSYVWGRVTWVWRHDGDGLLPLAESVEKSG
jgi:ketosteroid isomerase-like protein